MESGIKHVISQGLARCCRVGRNLGKGRCHRGNAPSQKEGPEGSGVTPKFNRFIHTLGTKLWGVPVKLPDGRAGRDSQEEGGSGQPKKRFA